MEAYTRSKFRITLNQTSKDTLIYKSDDKGIVKGLELIGNQVETLPIKPKDYQNGIRSKEGKPFDLTLRGSHNLFNAFVAVTMSRLVGATEEDIAKGLATFVNHPHRMQHVATIEGVSYINDSKATNVDATFYALDAISKPIIWIAGGTDKGNDYGPLFKLAKQKVKVLICLGVDNKKLISDFTPIVDFVLETTKVSEVLRMAQEMTKSGDTVLLSPACASFDLFENYIDRGEQFIKEVKRIVAEKQNT